MAPLRSLLDLANFQENDTEMSGRVSVSSEDRSSSGHQDADSLGSLDVDRFLSDSNSPDSCHSAPTSAPMALVRNVLTAKQAHSVMVAAGQLGSDPTSAHFVSRNKSMGFVLCLGGQWFQITQNFVNQNFDYNDLSGGYKRFYDLFPRTFIECAETQHVLSEFKRVFGIPEGQLVFVQVQSNNVSPEDEGRCLTGQGIHCDGADCAMIVCLDRKNVVGARNSLYKDTDGDEPILDRHLLEVGSSLSWKDNEVYHYVEPVQLLDKSRKGSRTIMILNYPAIHYITGEANTNNTLPPSGKHPKYVKDLQ